jgi:hypothetical protein
MGLVGMAGPASARTFTRCDYDGDHCVRIHCDWDGDRCWRQSLYRDRTYYRGHGGGHWVCNRWGDCHWSYWHPNPHVRLHLDF